MKLGSARLGFGSARSFTAREPKTLARTRLGSKLASQLGSTASLGIALGLSVRLSVSTITFERIH